MCASQYFGIFIIWAIITTIGMVVLQSDGVRDRTSWGESFVGSQMLIAILTGIAGACWLFIFALKLISHKC